VVNRFVRGVIQRIARQASGEVVESGRDGSFLLPVSDRAGLNIISCGLGRGSARTLPQATYGDATQYERGKTGAVSDPAKALSS